MRHLTGTVWAKLKRGPVAMRSDLQQRLKAARARLCSRPQLTFLQFKSFCLPLETLGQICERQPARIIPKLGNE
jgi:hypothetical protein